MRKYLLFLILPFIFISSVKADNECIDLLAVENPSFEVASNQVRFMFYSNGSEYRYPIADGETYTFFFDDANNPPVFSSILVSQIISLRAYAFTPGGNWYYWQSRDINLGDAHVLNTWTFSDSNSNLSTANLVLYSGNNISSLTTPFKDGNNHVAHLVKGSVPCNPYVPPSEPESSVLLSTFISLYTDRLSFLSNSFTSNPYLFAMIGILFAWIVLELFLHFLHLKGGYKK